MSQSAVETLEQRIAALELGAQYDADRAAVRRVELEFLEKLKEIRTQLVAEQSRGRGSGGADGAELVRLREENAALKQVNEKLAYRVKHVVASLNMLLDEQKQQTSSNS